MLLRNIAAEAPAWKTDSPNYLARYVSPRAARFAFGAVQNLDATEHDTPTPAELRDRARAVYEQIADQQIAYDGPGYAPQAGSQQIFRSHEIMDRKRATCVDFAAAFASLALDAKLHPYLVRTQRLAESNDHVFVAVRTVPYDLPLGNEPADAFRQFVADGLVLPIEATGMASAARALSFDEAVKTARGHSESESDEIDFVGDIPWLHKDRDYEPYRWTELSKSRLLTVAMSVLLVGVLGGALWVYINRTPRMDGVATGNIVVFPFKGEKTGNPVSSQIATDMATELSPNWRVEGPDWPRVDQFPAAERTDSAELLDKRNVGLAVYGSMSDDNPDEIEEVWIWVTDSFRGAQLLGTIGPIVLIEDLPDVSTDERISLTLESLKDLEKLVEFMELYGNTQLCASLDCDAIEKFEGADGAIFALFEVADNAKQRGSNIWHSSVSDLAYAFAGQAALNRIRFTDEAHAFADQRVAIFVGLAGDAFANLNDDLERVSTPNREDIVAMRVRALIGLAGVDIARHGCIEPWPGPDDPLGDAGDRLAEVDELILAVRDGYDPLFYDIEFRLVEAKSRMAFCMASYDSAQISDARRLHRAVRSEYSEIGAARAKRMAPFASLAYWNSWRLGGDNCASYQATALETATPLIRSSWQEQLKTLNNTTEGLWTLCDADT